MSPFSTTTIPVHATNLAAYSAERGLFVRSALHIDGQGLAFSSEANGTRSATVDLIGLVFNSDGVQLSNTATRFNVTLENAPTEQAIRTGFVYTTRVLVGIPAVISCDIPFAIVAPARSARSAGS